MLKSFTRTVLGFEDFHYGERLDKMGFFLDWGLGDLIEVHRTIRGIDRIFSPRQNKRA